MRGWLFPYLKSRVLPGDFHPIIAYLFTEWKCNLDCHYCWAFNNGVKGMTEEVARRSIDWLEDTRCRVLALMGGEVLLRPQFAHKVVDYAAQEGILGVRAHQWTADAARRDRPTGRRRRRDHQPGGGFGGGAQGTAQGSRAHPADTSIT